MRNLLPFFLVVGVLLACGSSDPDSPSSTSTPSATNQQESSPVDYRYIHETVNVRFKPTTESEAINQLHRGDKVVVVDITDGWAEVYKGGTRLGYVREDLLNYGEVPNFEVESWNWRTDPGFGSDGAVIWVVEVRNNTDQYVDQVRVDLTTYDGSGQVIDSDFTYVQNISPRSTKSTKSYADYYGPEEKARIQISQR